MDDLLLFWCGLAMGSYCIGNVASMIKKHQSPSPQPVQRPIFAEFLRVSSESEEDTAVPDTLEEEFQELERSIAARQDAANGVSERQAQCLVAYD